MYVINIEECASFYVQLNLYVNGILHHKAPGTSKTILKLQVLWQSKQNIKVKLLV